MPYFISFVRRPRTLALLATIIGLILHSSLVQSAANAWLPTGSMSVVRMRHSATLLPDGKVLVVGGDETHSASTAELYDPTTRVWSYAGGLPKAFEYHTATLLPNGTVLIAGGHQFSGSNYVGVLKDAYIFDPSTHSFSNTGSMNTARYDARAVLLSNGKVLVVGGQSGGSSAELYDPATGTWSITGTMSTYRLKFTLTLLLNGKVLATGGTSSPSAELYDPATGTWRLTANTLQPRQFHAAALLQSGKVLVAGGQYYDSQNILHYQNSAEIYDVTTETWQMTGSMNKAHSNDTATLLADGQVLLAINGSDSIGGPTGGPFTANPEVYDPSTEMWRLTASPLTIRSSHTATLLPNGQVLVVGGYNGYLMDSAELYEPSTIVNTPTATDTPTATASDTPTATDIPTPTATDTPAATASDTPTATDIPTPTATDTPAATATDTPTATPSIAPATAIIATFTATPTITGLPNNAGNRVYLPVTVFTQ